MALISDGRTTADPYLVDGNGYNQIPLLTVGDEIPLLEGEFPFLQTDPNGPFPIDNLNIPDSGDSPLTPSATETFTLPGSIDGVHEVSIEGVHYVYVNHNFTPDTVTETNGGQINGSRISLLAFDENWNIIGGRNLINLVRAANVEATNALRETIDPTTGELFTGLVFGEYILDPATGNYVPNPDASPGGFIVGDPNFLALESDVPGQTWQQRLENTFAPVLHITDHDNFANLGSISSADTGFRRRAGAALPFTFSGDSSSDGVAYFHISNSTTVPIEGFGAFAKGEIISAIEYRQTADENGTPTGVTILLSPEASSDGEIYMFRGDQFANNAGGFADLKDTLFVLKVTDGAGTVIDDETGIAEGTDYTAEWVLVDGDALSNLDAVPEGKAVNTLNAEALSEWVNGDDRSTNFDSPGGIAEDPNNPSNFYFTSSGGLYHLTFSEEFATGNGSIELVLNDGNNYDNVEVDENGNIVLQDNSGNSYLYNIAGDTVTPYAQTNQGAIAPDGELWQNEGLTEVNPNYEGTGLGVYLTAVSANNLTQENLGTGGQLVLGVPDLNPLDTQIYRFQSNAVPGSYLFTGPGERDSINNDPNLAGNFLEEGGAFKVSTDGGDGLIGLYRFRSNQGTYLLVGEEERTGINNDPNLSGEYTEEGLAFYVYGVGADEATEFSRFRRLDTTGVYLYATGDEATNIRTNLTDTFVEEGPAFEVGI